MTKNVIRRALREACDAEGDPFTVSAYRHWHAEQLEGLGRWERERYPSYHTIWARYRRWCWVYRRDEEKPPPSFLADGWRVSCAAAIPRTAPGAGQRLPHT